MSEQREGDEVVLRERLDRRRILVAAVELIDEVGLHELSMRRLGRGLGVEAMALYRYVPSRESLLDGVLEFVVDELYADPDVHLLPHDGGRSQLRALHKTRRARRPRRPVARAGATGATLTPISKSSAWWALPPARGRTRPRG